MQKEFNKDLNTIQIGDTNEHKQKTCVNNRKQ